MLIGCVVDHQLDDYADAPAVGLPQEGPEGPWRPIAGVHTRVVGDVVPVVFKWRREEREKPDGCDSQVLEVVQLGRQSPKIPPSLS